MTLDYQIISWKNTVSKMNAPKVILGGFFQGKTIYSYNIIIGYGKENS